MGSELHRDEFGTIIHYPDDGILELRWLKASARMSDQDFMLSMERYAGLAGHHRTPNMIVDIRDFLHNPGEDVAAWREENIIPSYNAAGVRKFAFLLPEGAPGSVESGSGPATEPPGDFPTGYFASRERILDWFQR
ncbi:MAG: hypothetical protein ACRDIW_01450 [Actinomycetota bacterium]